MIAMRDLERRPDGEMIAYNLFRSRNKNIFIGDAEPWSDFPSSREAFEFDPLQATMTIKQDGLYFIYVQVRVCALSCSPFPIHVRRFKSHHVPNRGPSLYRWLTSCSP